MSELVKKLQKIQTELKAPKGQYNSFGRYHYRSCEDILEAVKPLLAAQGCALRLFDEPVCIGDWHYIKATAELLDGEDEIGVTAYARESITKKGMDDSQITGAASSYARKYALNGLFCVDDTKDADRTIVCRECGEPIIGERSPDGTIMSDQDVAKETKGYCRRCAAKRRQPAKKLVNEAQGQGVPVSQSAESSPFPAVLCKQCGQPIVDIKLKDGRILSAQAIVQQYGELCAKCVKANERNKQK